MGSHHVCSQLVRSDSDLGIQKYHCIWWDYSLLVGHVLKVWYYPWEFNIRIVL
jgi:hypothetical protein